MSFIDSNISLVERSRMYDKGGVICITSRCAIIDLLTERLRARYISGILISQAHRVSPVSIESFVIKIYREKNKKGWIKAFTDSPTALTNGFNKVEKL